ncbi:MAG TPA: glycerol-3-phosphate dehydrogenase/oxidase [Acidimicrobiales bacterium]|nr:glycerol-3-phosphate dehydrogenase/oxidase [Acidimicrobiales bacterium]
MFDRATALAGLRAARRFDVLVVGGGITGAGVALDAASRGLRTALVERGDFASGTSSASSKLVHGGLRYVSQGELGLVAQALAERQRLLSNASHLVQPLPFVLPLSGGAAAARSLGAALWLYDLAGGGRIGQVHRRLSRDETLSRVPALRADAFGRSYLYLDAHADDARLTLAVVRTAVLDHGAVAANHASVVGLLRSRSGRVVGAVVGADGEEIEVRASVVVNATGVWSDDFGRMSEGEGWVDTIRPAKGVHLTVSGARLPASVAAVLPVPADGRSVFVIPWPGTDRVYVGTTDTDFEGDVDRPRCTAADVDYLLGAVNGWVSDPLTSADVVGCWAGLRPLVAGGVPVAAGGGGADGRPGRAPRRRGSRALAAGRGRTADLSRRHRLSQSDGGVVTITGGKLTTYRRMAADTVDEVAGLLGVGARSHTAGLHLRGAGSGAAFRSLDVGAGDHLGRRYGTEAGTVRALVDDDPSLGERLVDGLAYLRAEVVYAVRHEMARTLEDVLDRRLRARILDRDGAAAAASDVAAIIGPELGWSTVESDAHVAAYRAELDDERVHAGLPGGPVPTGPRHRRAG